MHALCLCIPVFSLANLTLASGSDPATAAATYALRGKILSGYVLQLVRAAQPSRDGNLAKWTNYGLTPDRASYDFFFFARELRLST